MTNKLLPCPFCEAPANLEDHRLIWCVRCSKCSACVLGERAPEPHGDGESSDEVQDAQAQKMSAETDWAHYEQTAIDAWNKRAAPEAPRQEPVMLEIPDECPHLIVFDDADREQLMFAGTGARKSALQAWEKISTSWNAHLFVRVERNSRDDRFPSATTAPLSPGHSGGGARMVLPERKSVFDLEGEPGLYRNGAVDGWNACLDKVKELNQ